MATGTSEKRPKDQTYSDWQVGKDLGACMKELYARNLWTDVRFRCKDHGEEERIHAHKIVLAARSPVFQAMFYGANAEAKNDEKLKDAEKKILDLFLRYIYTDNVVLEEEDAASELLQMAHLYQVPRLVQLCADYLEKIIKIENVCAMLELAAFYEIKTLREACYIYIDHNATAVIKTVGFMDLSKECLINILKGDTFYAAEEEIFAKTEEWACKRLNEQGFEQNGDNLRKILDELFYYLRLPTLSYQELVNCTRNKEYLSAEESKDITHFIKQLPGTSVTSNSTVARVPMIETLAFNAEYEDFKSYHDSFSCKLEVHVSRNVKLLELHLCSMIPYVESSTYLCKRTTGYNREDNVDMYTTASLQHFVSEYMDPCKIVSFGRYSKRWRNDERKICEYETLDGISCPDCLYFVAEGTLTVGTFTHNFKFNVSNKCSPIVALTKPLVLNKRDQPYICTINVRYPSESAEFMLKVKSRRTKSQDTVISKAGHVRVSASSSTFIKSIKIQTLANRFEDSFEESK